MRIKSCFVLLFFCALNRTATNLSAENTGAAFLKLGVGARQVGMGNAWTAVADDVTAVYWNPAGLSNIGKSQLGAMHSEWIDDVRYDFIGFVMPSKRGNPPQAPFDKGGTFGISVLYLYMGDIEKRNEDRTVSGNFTANDTAVTLSYGKKISSKLDLGGNVKFIRETIENESANGLALDFGALYHTGIKELTLGLTLKNLGPPMKFINESYNLPLTAAAGFSYPIIGIINIAADLRSQILDGKTDLSLGAELTPIRNIAFRAGYMTKLINAIQDSAAPLNQIRDVTGLGLGLGFKIFSFHLDYSFAPFGNLGNTHKISFIMGF